MGILGIFLVAAWVDLPAGNLWIVSGLPGCRVSIDGRINDSMGPDGRWLTPELENGIHTVAVSKPGYTTITRIVRVDEVVRDEVFSLVAESGGGSPGPAPASSPERGGVSTPERAESNLRILLVDGNLAGVTVLLDGKPVEVTRTDGTATIMADQNSHRLEFHVDGYAADPVLVPAGSLDQTISFRMAAVSGGAGTSGSDPRGGDTRDRTMVFLVWAVAGIFLALVGAFGWLAFSSRKRVLFHNRYIIRDVIGRGGMATVYRAKDRNTGRLVALKVMDPGLARDLDLLKKFLREGEVLRTLNTKHPEAPIVRVVDFGRESGRTNGRPFIAMELLQGRDALTYLQGRGRLSTEEAKGIVRQVLSALAAAHAEGVYHRDLSPDNILITDGHGRGVRLIDFGVARHEYTSAGTLDGSITGKPPYMSPEQCRGGKVDGRSDLYSLGVVFYTLLAGKPPFVAVNPLEVMKKHESEPVPPLPGDVPKGVAVIVYKMLEKDPAQRFSSAEAVRQAMEL